MQAVVLLLIWAIPATGVWLLSLSARRGDETALRPVAISFVTIGSQQQDASRRVKLVFTGSAPLSMASPVQGTLVSRAKLTPGKPFRDGEAIAQIGARHVVASVGRVPFYRELSQGDRGEDVKRLNQLLAALGLPTERGQVKTFTSRTAAGVRQLNTRVGASPGTRFMPDSAMFVAEGSSFASFEVGVGQAVSVGLSLGKMQSPPSALAVVDEASGAEVPVPGAGVSLRAPDGASLELSEIMPSAVALTVFRFALLHGRGATEPEVKSGGANPDLSYTGFQLVAGQPKTMGSIPPAALFTRPDGKMCVFEQPSDTAGSPQPIRLGQTVDSGQLGVVYVDPELIGRSIVADASLLAAETLQRC
ncbi:MAG: hypothetical protein CVT62_10140 [Actinobacteria bacterium HGW-Actinobacteria-2]|nr:MAG: hypothetical protein CVT62_10140 [Actinobacteria bacterium HGW-Actinobacteria-2]